MNRYLRILRERPHFRRLWTSNIVSNLGDWLSYIAISVLVVREDGSPLALAILFILHGLPYGLLAPVAGPVSGQRVERSKRARDRSAPSSRARRSVPRRSARAREASDRSAPWRLAARRLASSMRA